MEVIAVIAQRGGVGKTTTAHALGVGLSLYHGADVLFVDMDAQGNLSRTLEADPSAGDIVSVLTGRTEAKDAVQHTPHGDLIASSKALTGAEGEEALRKVGREYRLRKALESLSGAYTHVVIDTPPALSILTVNALTAASKVVIPAQAEDYSLSALERLRETLDAVKAYCNPSLQVDGVLLTRYNGRAVISRDMADMIGEAAEGMGTRLYETRIRECTAVKEAQAMREDIYNYAPRSNAAKDYRAFVAEFIGGNE